MTLPQYEQSDRPKAPPATTREHRSETGAVTSVDGIQCAPEAETPQMVKGHPSNTEIPAQGGGGREGDYRQPEGGTRHLSPSKIAGSGRRGCGLQNGQPARCAGTTSAESVEGRLFGSQGVEIPRTISRAFERMNAPRIRRDRLPEWFRAAVLSIAIGAVAVGLAHQHRMNALAANWEQINEF